MRPSIRAASGPVRADPCLRPASSVIALALALGLAAPLTAGQQSGRADPASLPAAHAALRHGTIVGTARDELEGRPLSGATVRIVGLERAVRTDDRGRFVFWQVPPGDHELHLELSALPGLGALALSAEAPVRSGRVTSVEIERPGPLEHRAMLCGAEADSEATGVIVGRVERPSGGAVAGTRVRVGWDAARSGAATASGGSGHRIRAKRRRATVETGRHGGFLVCDVPLDRRVTVGVADTSVAVLLPRARPFAEVSLGSTTAAGQEFGRRRTEAQTASLVGYVRGNRGSRVLRGARVRLLYTDQEAIAGREGFFRFGEVRPGEHLLTVEHLGYRSDTVRIRLEQGASTVARLTLAADPVELPTLEARVERRVKSLQIREFYRRLSDGHGRFVTGEEVARYGWIGALRRVPGVRLVPCHHVHSNCYQLDVDRGGTPVVEGECSPDVYVDGMRVVIRAGGRVDPLERLRSYSPQFVEGIEIHDASTVPAQYSGIGTACGVVLVWTQWGGRPPG